MFLLYVFCLRITDKVLIKKLKTKKNRGKSQIAISSLGAGMTADGLEHLVTKEQLYHHSLRVTSGI